MRNVNVTLAAKDVYEMIISQKLDLSDSKWITYKPSHILTLTEGDGEKIVYAQFRDKAGNVTEIVNAVTKLDIAAPIAKSILIDFDSMYCTQSDKQVTLSLNAEGADEIAISNVPFNAALIKGAKWEQYSETKSWVLDGDDGKKVVYAIFRDHAGNTSNPVNDNILLDRKPPSNNSITINKEAKLTNAADKKVQLALSTSGAEKMMISNKANFSDSKWTAIKTQSDWMLDGEDGVKVVYAKFKDKAGNVSKAVTAQITLDTKPPDNLSLNIDQGSKFCTNKEKKVKINLVAKGASYMMLSQVEKFPKAKWEKFQNQKEITLIGNDGEKPVWVKFKDESGNISEAISKQIMLDRTPPLAKIFMIDDGAESTSHKRKLVTLTIKSEGAKDMLIANTPDFSGEKWKTYQAKIENYKLEGDDGEKTIYLKLRDEAGNVSNPFKVSIKLNRES